jgi:hypothetical protein
MRWPRPYGQPHRKSEHAKPTRRAARALARPAAAV